MNTEANKRIMAQNIKRQMERKGITNQQLCDALGFKYTTFLDWIKGVTYPRIGKVEAMANYFGCEKSDLIEDKKEQPANAGDELSEEEKRFILWYRSQASEKDKAIVRMIVERDGE